MAAAVHDGDVARQVGLFAMRVTPAALQTTAAVTLPA
jgi:hypothetical protein